MITLPAGYRASEPEQALVFADGGLPELMRWIETTRPISRGTSGGADDTPNDFNGFSTWSEVVRWTQDGWAEGAARIEAGFPRPAFGAVSRRPHWGYDVAGEVPEVGRYITGDPRHMRRRKVEHGRAKVVVLYIGMGVRASVSTTEFSNFGIAVCQMIDALENNGTRVELNQATRAIMGNKAVTGWRVKSASDPLDIAALAFTYMHPAAHRRLQFQVRARVGSGLVGGSTDICAADVPDAPEGAIVFAGISENAGACKTLKGAREFLRLRINQGAGTELITEDMLEHLN